jgi:hypothetical protein
MFTDIGLHLHPEQGAKCKEEKGTDYARLYEVGESRIPGSYRPGEPGI